jgi:sec-independent protein translocase protein TatA
MGLTWNPVHRLWTQVKENPMLADVFGLDAIWAVVIIAILLFGGAAIPKLARSLGSAKTQFEKGIDEGKKAGATDGAAASAAVDTPAPSAEEKTPGA